LIRDSYPFTGIDPGPYSRRVRAQGLSAQFRMILIRTQIQATSSKLQAASFIVDIEPYIWDNMITINKRITHDKIKKRPDNRTDTHSIRPEGSAGRTRSFETQAQKPARLRLWDGPAAAGAGRPVGRRAGMQHQLARSLKLRDLHAAVPGPDGRCASSGGWRNGYHYSDQGTKIHGSQEEVQGPGLINRGLRAPTPRNKRQVASYKRQAASSKFSSRSDQAPSGKRQAASSKPQAASSLIADPS